MDCSTRTFDDLADADPRLRDLAARAAQLHQTLPEAERLSDGWYGRGGVKSALLDLVGDGRNLTAHPDAARDDDDPHGLARRLRRIAARDAAEEAAGTAWLCSSAAYDLAYDHLVTLVTHGPGRPATRR